MTNMSDYLCGIHGDNNCSCDDEMKAIASEIYEKMQRVIQAISTL